MTRITGAYAPAMVLLIAGTGTLAAGEPAVNPGVKKWADTERAALAALAKTPPAATPDLARITDPKRLTSTSLTVSPAPVFVLQLVLRNPEGGPLTGVTESDDVLQPVEVTGNGSAQPPLQTSIPQGYEVNFSNFRPLQVQLRPAGRWEIRGDRSRMLDWSKAATDTVSIDLTEAAGANGADAAKGADPVEALFESPNARTEGQNEAARLAHERAAAAPARQSLPVPAASAQQAATDLAAAEQAIQKAVQFAGNLTDSRPTVRPAGSLPDRLFIWRQLQEALVLLDEADAAGGRAASELSQLQQRSRGKAPGDPLAALPAAARPAYAGLPKVIATLELQAQELRAEALWWQAQAEDPANPPRERAISVLTGAAPKVQQGASELKEQLDRYRRVAEAEAALHDQLGTAQPALTLTRKTYYTLKLEVRVARQ